MVSRSARLQDRQVAQRLCSVRDRGLQQPDEAPAQGLDRRFVEQVAGVLQHARRSRPACRQ